MKITDVKRIEQKEIDGSDTIYYSAMVNGEKLAQYKSGGPFHPHLTKEEWIEKVKNEWNKI